MRRSTAATIAPFKHRISDDRELCKTDEAIGMLIGGSRLAWAQGSLHEIDVRIFHRKTAP